MRSLLFTLAALCVGFGQAPAAPVAAAQSLAGVPPCGDGDTAPPSDPQNPFVARQCKIEHGGQRMLVHFAAAPADGADRGTITVDVLGASGAVRQTLTETGVDGYYDPAAVDFDHDGHLDVEIIREGGVANEDLGLWRFNPSTGRFDRIGEVSGFAVQRTADGYISVANRSGAANYSVEFYRLDESALTLILSVNLIEEDPEGPVICTIGERGPALASLHMSDAALRGKFCADPSTRLFDQ
jgi:hypothetical protein